MGFLNDEDSQRLYWLAQPVKIEGSSDLWIVLDVIPSRREITLTVAKLDGSGRRTVPSVACKIQDFRRLARRYAPDFDGDGEVQSGSERANKDQELTTESHSRL